MKIVHIDTETSWRGGQQQVFYLHSGLVDRNIYSIIVCNKNSELKNKCTENNLPFLEIQMRGELDFIAAFRIARFCKKESINIIQAHSAHALTIGILVKMFVPNVKLIGVRRVDFSIGNNWLSRLKYNTLKVNRIVCISDFIKEVMIRDRVKTDKLVTIKSGINISKFDDVENSSKIRMELGINTDTVLFGTVAAFVGHKDYPNLLRGFKLSVDQDKGIKLVMVGEGKLLKDMSRLSEELGISNYVIFTGFRNDVGQILKALDVFVLASKKEGLGTSILDALSVGLPVIATSTGGIPEIVRNNKNGIIVSPKQPEELAKAILFLAKNKNERKKLATNARTSIEDFSIEKTIQRNIDLYDELLKVHG